MTRAKRDAQARSHKSVGGRQPTKGALLTTLEVARRLGISEQRVRQLEASGLRKLRGFAALREHVQ